MGLTKIIDREIRATGSMRVVDLAGGTGSNVRFLAEHLPCEQSWVVVDHDPELLARLPAQMQSWCDDQGFAFDQDASGYLIHGDRPTCHVSTQDADLAVDVERVISDGVHLVTASALLDLVSEQWLDRLVRRCEQIGSAALFGLTYGGQVRCSPEEPEDALVLGLVNQHQRRDKGFGPALGPDATLRAQDLFRAHGFQVRLDNSDWVLGGRSEALQRALIEGWAEAASATATDGVSTIETWKERRLTHVSDGHSSLTIGHQDMVAWLPESPGRRWP